MPKALLSVIVPVYNKELYIDRCVNSLVSQSYRELEILLVDDGSSDGSGRICDRRAEADCRVKVIHTENRGVNPARELGCKSSTGRYITFVDADDTIPPDYIERMVDALESTGSDISVSGNCHTCDNGHLEFLTLPDAQFEGTKDILRFMLDNYCSLWAQVFKRELLEGVNFIPTTVGEDTAVTVQALLKASKLVSLKDLYYNYFYCPGSITVRCEDSPEMLKSWLDTHSYIHGLIKDMGPEFAANSAKQVAVKCFLLIRALEKIKPNDETEIAKFDTMLKERYAVMKSNGGHSFVLSLYLFSRPLAYAVSRVLSAVTHR